jgi:hypothetical protein
MLTLEAVERLMIQCAQDKTDITYSEALSALGFAFSRPKMRQLCRLLGEADARAREIGEPELAVLLVRASDRMPGDGWWESRTRYRGEWAGKGAKRYVQKLQQAVFDYWSRGSE